MYVYRMKNGFIHYYLFRDLTFIFSTKCKQTARNFYLFVFLIKCFVMIFFGQQFERFNFILKEFS